MIRYLTFKLFLYLCFSSGYAPYQKRSVLKFLLLLPSKVAHEVPLNRTHFSSAFLLFYFHHREFLLVQTLLKVGYGPIRNVTFSSTFFSRSYAILSVIISVVNIFWKITFLRSAYYTPR